MRLAVLWVAATTVLLPSSGCFRPDLPIDECSAAGTCPGTLNCIDGFCCEGTSPCASGDGDGDGDIDAAPDARQEDFTEHESPYSCSGDPDVSMLLHFDAFSEDCRSLQVVARVDEVLEPTAKFGPGVRLNTNSPFTQYVDIDPGLTLPYTIEAWIQLESLPDAGDTMIITSMVKPIMATEMIEDAAWRLGVTSSGQLRLDVFSAGSPCNTTHPLSPFTTTAVIAPGVPTHVRAVMTGSAVNLYINGFNELSEGISGSAPCGSTTAHLRLGGVDRGGLSSSEMTNFPVFSGFIDEVRLSTIAR